MQNADTIAAIATAPGQAGIGVVRISGSAAGQILRTLTGHDVRPRVATLCDFRAADGSAIDRGIALWFRQPHSYTGEDVAELQGHGGPAVMQMLLHRCLELGARPAAPGEFTQRAFLNGKLDLAQAESVADLIAASSEAGARGALRSLSGAFSARINHLNRELIELRTLVEATLDFPEEDVEHLEKADAKGRLDRIQHELSAVRHAARQGNLLRTGARVVLIGRPNVGKSSLLNRLADEDVAIVTEVPGTTRDPLRHELVLEGIPLHVIDTAGLRVSDDPVEKLGIEKAWREIAGADIALLVMDVRQGLSPDDQSILERLPGATNKIFIFNKIDLTRQKPVEAATQGGLAVYLSAKTGEGLGLLREVLLRAIGWQPTGEGQFMARQRHLQALDEAASALERASSRMRETDLLAEELRLAHHALGGVTGEFTSDDLLGEIFSRFCIGK